MTRITGQKFSGVSLLLVLFAIGGVWGSTRNTQAQANSSLTFTPDRDATVLATPGREDTNFGASHYGVGRFEGVPSGDERVLVSFDVKELAGQFAQINSITLRLTASSTVPTTSRQQLAVEVYAISPANREWIEGAGVDSGGGPTLPGDSTWSYRNFAWSPWAGSPGLGTPGVDYLASRLAVRELPAGMPALGDTVDFTFVGTSSDLTNLINTWLADNAAGAPNPGLLLLAGNYADLSNEERVFFLSRELATSSSSTPQLIVTYTPSLPVGPTNRDQCKEGGWYSLYRADGTAFKNQGDCIQYVNTGK